MKRLFTFLFLAFLGTQLVAQELNITGTVFDEDGMVVPAHEVFINVSDSATGFNYSSVVSTNEAGAFVESLPLGDLTQGDAIVSTESCNSIITIIQGFNPGNYDLSFEFVICTDTTGGGGNDTIVEGCENYFYYEGPGLYKQFMGFVDQDGEVVYSWDFGDGNTGEGQSVEHTYAEEGVYEVSLHTTLNDTCEFTSTQMVDVETGGGNDSTYCMNDFSYTVDEFIVNVEGWVNDGVVAALYWDFGDGTSAEGITASHQYSQAGTYDITFTTIYEVDNNDTCVAITTKSVSIQGGSSGDMLYGTVYRGEAYLDYGRVELFHILNDTVGGDDDIVLYDAAIIDSAGMYFFQDVPSGNYLILAQATQQSIYFDQTVPTYYGDVIHWVDATIISLGDPMNPYDINLVMTNEMAGGEGMINGEVVGEGFKAQLIEEDIVILLLDENSNPLSFTLSQLDSGFDFNNLSFGSYTVYAEVVGMVTEPGMVTLSAENPTATIDIVVTPNGVITGINDELDMEISGSIYPNPVGSLAQLDLNLTEAKTVEWALLNQMGQVLQSSAQYMSSGLNRVQVNVSDYPSGVYFIQLISDKTTTTQKFIKK